MIKYEHLVGIPFSHGTDDCYGICRRFFWDNFHLSLTDYARPDNWWDNGDSLYTDNFEREGFNALDVQPSKAEIADVFLMSIRSSVPNHAVIYIGNGLILHHLYGRFSSVERFRFSHITTHVLRHPLISVPKQRLEKVQFRDHILPHKRSELFGEGQ